MTDEELRRSTAENSKESAELLASIEHLKLRKSENHNPEAMKFKPPTAEKQRQTTAMVQKACAEMDKVNQSFDELIETLEREDKLSAMRAARKLRKN